MGKLWWKHFLSIIIPVKNQLISAKYCVMSKPLVTSYLAQTNLIPIVIF